MALIVDHAQREREDYADYLAQRGINTVEAGDGTHGIAKAGTLLPDVIAVDLGRPHRDVVDMCFRLKRQDATKHIPIIAVMEAFTPTEIELAMRAGCASVLVKPCLPEVLFDEIRRVLASAEPAA
jgi:CheY-like chemotaxis protein